MTNQKHGSQRTRPTAIAGAGELSKPPGPSCRSCARLWCDPGEIGFMVRSRSMKPMWAALSTAFAVAAHRANLSWSLLSKCCRQRVWSCASGTRQRRFGISLIPFVCSVVEAGSEVRTDGWNGYNGLCGKGYNHHRINLSQSGDPAHVSLPGVHSVASLLKRWLLGTHQGSVTAAHLDAYLNEFAFRFNRRHSAAAACSFSDCCNTLLSPRRLAIDRRDLSTTLKTTASSGHCTKAATPLNDL